jgi:hypothetical protein
MNHETSHIESTIADLRAWRDQIDAAILTLEHFSAKGASLPSSAPPGAPRANGEVTNDAFFQMTVPDAAEKYLRIMKATKEIPEIAEALLRGGLKSSSKNFSDMARTVLSRDERFVRVPSGGWGLSEWYPAMRKEKKPKSPPATPPKSPFAPGTKTASDSLAGNVNGDAASKILASLAQNLSEEWTATKLSEKTGLKIKTVQGTIFRLRHDGKITNRVDGKGYVLTGGS